MTAYYNENDPKAAAWLRELIFDGQIAWGDVDERSIEDVLPSELAGYTQCHFFAGIGGWSYALRLAGWPDDRAVWTGSCPCQPFSQAGKGEGFDDSRHLWPAFGWLIDQCSPPVIFGEQVASPAGLAWLDVVLADLESSDYTCAAADICAAGVGAPHIRQRLYWMANHHHHPGCFEHAQRDGQPQARSEEGARGSNAGGRGELMWLGDANDGGGRRNANDGGGRRNARTVPSTEGSVEGRVRRIVDGIELASAAGELGNNNNTRLQIGSWSTDGQRVIRVEGAAVGETSLVRGFWGGADWIYCRDSKYRPAEPRTFPLAHGVPGRVGLLRGYGNAIVPQVAAAFIGAYLDV